MADIDAVTETFERAPATSSLPVTTDPSTRGSLSVTDRVVERIAAIATAEVPGVVRSGSRWDRTVGRRLPHVDTRTAGRRARLVIEIAAIWATALGEVTAGVRATVAERLHTLAGIDADSVDVVVTKIVPPSSSGGGGGGGGKTAPPRATARDAGAPPDALETDGLTALGLVTPSVVPATPLSRRPVSPGAIQVAAVTMALLLTALGVVGLRDVLTHAGLLAGQPWLDAVIRDLDGLRPQWWAVPVGLGAGITGLGLLIMAVRPRRRTTFPLTARGGVVLSGRAVGRLAARTAEEVDGVLDVRTRVSRRRIVVSTVVTGEASAVAVEVRSAVEERLAVLEPVPTVRVTARTGSGP